MKKIVFLLMLFCLVGCGKEEQTIGMPVAHASVFVPSPTSTPTITPTPTENPLPPSVTEELLDCMEVTKPKYTDREMDVLMRCVEAEACDQDLIGKCLVARVILNRVDSGDWANDIVSVVYQKGQFAVVTNGSIDRVKVSEETRKAVDMVLDGWDRSEGAEYFRMQTKNRTEWHYSALTFLFDYGTHSFFK